MQNPELLRYKEQSPYKKLGSLTREQYLFNETRIVGELYLQGMTDTALMKCFWKINLYE